MGSIDNLHGGGKGVTRDAYFKDNRDVMKLSYIRCMSNVSFYHKYTHKIVDSYRLLRKTLKQMMMLI